MQRVWVRRDNEYSYKRRTWKSCLMKNSNKKYEKGKEETINKN